MGRAIQVIPKIEGSHQKLELRLYSGKGKARQRVQFLLMCLILDNRLLGLV